MPDFHPAYLKLLDGRGFKERVEQAYELLSVCEVCAWECPVDRRAGKIGVCQTGMRAKVSSYGPHLGEEEPLRGRQGSGTIFLTRCNLRCQFCQNHDISQTDSGNKVEPEDMATLMLELQARGCHNINFVSPSHVVPQIMASVLIAAHAGLKIPLVYNTGGYDSIAMLKLLDGIVDIYMPDMKYADPDIARRYSKIRNYPQVNQAAVHEMYRQVGDLQIDQRGVATRGLLVRHLVLPNNLAGTDQIVQFLANDISTNTYLNLMDQYRPAYKAHQYQEINRPITHEEYQAGVQMALDADINRLDRRRARSWRLF